MKLSKRKQTLVKEKGKEMLEKNITSGSSWTQ
jgi:hypothetical protein